MPSHPSRDDGKARVEGSLGGCRRVAPALAAAGGFIAASWIGRLFASVAGTLVWRSRQRPLRAVAAWVSSAGTVGRSMGVHRLLCAPSPSSTQPSRPIALPSIWPHVNSSRRVSRSRARSGSAGSAAKAGPVRTVRRTASTRSYAAPARAPPRRHHVLLACLLASPLTCSTMFPSRRVDRTPLVLGPRTGLTGSYTAGTGAGAIRSGGTNSSPFLRNSRMLPARARPSRSPISSNALR